jgi:hypothetical protein
MSFIEDDFLYAFGFLLFIGIIYLAWLSTHVDHIHLPTTLFVVEQQTHRRNASPTPSLNSSLSSANETLTDIE